MRCFKSVTIGAVLAGLVGGTASVPAQAHHSFPSVYVLDQTVTIEGTVANFLFRNPHSFVDVMVPDRTGRMVMWRVEWGAENALEKDLTSGTLKPGDKVAITGNPARDATLHRLRMIAIERPSDGWKWAGPVSG